MDDKDIRKHRRDVFRLAAALPANAGPGIAESVHADLHMQNIPVLYISHSS